MLAREQIEHESAIVRESSVVRNPGAWKHAHRTLGAVRLRLKAIDKEKNTRETTYAKNILAPPFVRVHKVVTRLVKSENLSCRLPCPGTSMETAYWSCCWTIWGKASEKPYVYNKQSTDERTDVEPTTNDLIAG